MLPRKKLDIEWRDLGFALRRCLRHGDRDEALANLERFWSGGANALASLSVRSGFDALLGVLDWPAGSEVLVSAVTIRDMTRIVEFHGLRSVPVDVDMESLSIRPEALARALTPQSKAVLAAHLFGSRMDMNPVIEFARQHNLYVFEDCAQAYAADDYQGHPDSDVAMFSFGPIKTATALGGALLRFRDPELCQAVKATQAKYPLQTQGMFLRRVFKYSLLKFLSGRLPYTVFVAMCRLMHKGHDKIISRATRGFAGGDFLNKIRRQPPYALLALLQRRLGQLADTRSVVQERTLAATTAAEQLAAVLRPGADADYHTHWVFPIISSDPDRLIAHLWRHGFDATRGASSLYVVPPPGNGQPSTEQSAAAQEAARVMAGVVYLPVYAGVCPQELHRMADLVLRFEQSRAN